MQRIEYEGLNLHIRMLLKKQIKKLNQQMHTTERHSAIFCD